MDAYNGRVMVKCSDCGEPARWLGDRDGGPICAGCAGRDEPGAESVEPDEPECDCEFCHGSGFVWCSDGEGGEIVVECGEC